MSDEETKYKHSKRRHKDQASMERQYQIHKQNGLDPNLQYEKHRFAKHHAMDCGNSSCTVCGNPRKIYKQKSIQEKRFDQPEIYNAD